MLKKFVAKGKLPDYLYRLKNELELTLSEKMTVSEEQLTRSDQFLLQRIRKITADLNINNISRTMAYLDFYLKFPEIHWAFLGHMVSRNGGWNMTDLKGDMLRQVMDRSRRQMFFQFLERGNWLIFQDIYPQFLLYAESRRRRRNLFYLLPYLHVSRFMKVMWNEFLRNGEPYLLAAALIINEQSYLEKRVILNEMYKHTVLQTLEFKLQDLLSMSHILFPFKEKREMKVKLCGWTLHHFNSLHERIILGKNLYKLLFQNQKQWKKILRWAYENPHTGSRKDYWPDIFNDVHEGIPGPLLSRRLHKCQLKEGAAKFYSPKLVYAWENVTHPQAEVGDWCEGGEMIKYLIKDDRKINGEIAGEYCETLEQLEIAALAKKSIF